MNEVMPPTVGNLADQIDRPLPQTYVSVFTVVQTPNEFVIAFGSPQIGSPAAFGGQNPMAIGWTQSIVMPKAAAAALRDALSAQIAQELK